MFRVLIIGKQAAFQRERDFRRDHTFNSPISSVGRAILKYVYGYITDSHGRDLELKDALCGWQSPGEVLGLEKRTRSLFLTDEECAEL